MKNHKIFEDVCLLIGLGINEIAVSNQKNGCVSPVYSVFKINFSNDYLYFNYFFKAILWRKKALITRKFTRREFEIDMNEFCKMKVPHSNDCYIGNLSFLLSNVDEMIKELNEKLRLLT